MSGTSDPDTEADQEPDRSHLEVEDGCGCAEVWEHLSEQRADPADSTEVEESA